MLPPPAVSAPAWSHIRRRNRRGDRHPMLSVLSAARPPPWSVGRCLGAQRGNEWSRGPRGPARPRRARPPKMEILCPWPAASLPPPLHGADFSSISCRHANSQAGKRAYIDSSPALPVGSIHCYFKMASHPCKLQPRERSLRERECDKSKKRWGTVRRANGWETTNRSS